MTTANDKRNEDNGADQKLKDIFGTNTPFDVPDGYFEALSGRVMDSCKTKDRPGTRALILRPTFRRVATAAAVLLLAALVITIVFTQRETDINSLSDYSIDEAYRFNISNLAEFEDAYLLSLFEEDVADSMFILRAKTTDIDTDDIIYYLLADNHVEYYAFTEY